LKPTRRRRAWPVVAAAALTLVVAVGPGMLGTARASAATSVNGGGSSFAALEVQQWDAAVSRQPYDLGVNYTSNSSGAGRINYASGLYDFGASDVIYNDNEDGASTVAEAASRHPFKYVTVSAGGLAFMYNLVNRDGTRVTNLDLTRNEVCQIFTGELERWNDPELVATDHFLSGFDDPISPITRSDSAGESYVLSQYCLAVDPGDWRSFASYTDAHAASEPVPYNDHNMAEDQPVSYWPSQLSHGQNELQASGADNVADSVVDPTTGKDSITYVATAYAKVRSFPVASVQNAANQYTQPTPAAANLALSYARENNLGTFNLDFAGGNPAAYFPSTYSYIIAPDHVESNFPLGKGQTLSRYLCYAVGLGQQVASPLAYAPLAHAVVALSVSAIEGIPGAPPAKDCGTGGPAPIVTTPTTVDTPTTVTGDASTTTTTSVPGATTGTTAPGARTATTTPGVTPTTTRSGRSTKRTGRGGRRRRRHDAKTRAGTGPGGSGSAGSGSTGASGTAPSSPFGGEPGQTAGSSGASAAAQLAGASTGPSATTNFETWEWLLIGAAICAIGTAGRRISKRGGP
jgi:ABC-type phosphate transport system substrate-binding protein